MLAGLVRSGAREVGRIDRTTIMPVAGAIAAVPVVALFAAGLAWWGVRDAVTLALGANLVAVASRVGSARIPSFPLALDALVMGAVTFVGSASEPIAWLHVAALALCCLAGGILVAVGPVPAVVGTQGIIAFLIFGRAPETPLGALQLGALVALGAVVEVAFLATVRWPPASRRQREAIGAAYRGLAASARGEIEGTVAAAMKLDQASALLATAGWLERDNERTLRGLVDEARRTRLELDALALLRRRLESDGAPGPTIDLIGSAIAHLAAALERAGAAIAGARPDPRILEEVGAVDLALHGTDAGEALGPEADPVVVSSIRHLQALAGQVRAVDRLLREKVDPRWHIRARPAVRWRAGRTALAEDVDVVRANLTLASPALRHAVRLAVAVPLADVIARLLGLPRSYWVPLTVAVVLRPDFGSLFSRGAGRVLGTCVGAGVAGFLVAGVHPDTPATVGLVALSVWGAYTFFQSNFAVASTFIAAVVLFLLSVTQIDTTTTAFDRLSDTVLGGAVALAAYILWPTWSSGQARMAMSRLVAAQRAYLRSILSIGVDGPTAASEPLASLARQARLAWTEAEATVTRSLAEPTKWRIDGALAESMIATLLRLGQAAHGLRLATLASPLVRITPAWRDLRDALDTALGQLIVSLQANTTVAPLPLLRQLYEAVKADGTDPTIVIALDEVVDAVDLLGHLLGHGRLEHAPSGTEPD
jgi:uncharacterized membrane protein YccC